jgi:hypothetical protein
VPDENLVGSCNDERWVWRRAVTPPVTDNNNNNAGRSTTDPIRQGTGADAKSSPRAASAIAYSVLLDRHAARSRRASDRGPARSRNLRSACALAPGLDPAATLMSRSIMLHFYGDTEPARWLRIRSRMRHVSRRAAGRPRSDERGPPVFVGTVRSRAR